MKVDIDISPFELKSRHRHKVDIDISPFEFYGRHRHISRLDISPFVFYGRLDMKVDIDIEILDKKKSKKW